MFTDQSSPLPISFFIILGKYVVRRRHALVILGGMGGRVGMPPHGKNALPAVPFGVAFVSTPEKTYDVCMTYNAARDSVTTSFIWRPRRDLNPRYRRERAMS